MFVCLTLMNAIAVNPCDETSASAIIFGNRCFMFHFMLVIILFKSMGKFNDNKSSILFLDVCIGVFQTRNIAF